MVNYLTLRDVISGVPQGSVLGPIHFLCYVNYIDEGLTYKISKLADDMKITSKISATTDKLQFQLNLDILVSLHTYKLFAVRRP